MENTKTASPLLISKQEAALKLCLSLRTVDGLIKRGELTACRIGKRHLVTAESVLALIERGKQKAGEVSAQ